MMSVRIDESLMMSVRIDESLMMSVRIDESLMMSVRIDESLACAPHVRPNPGAQTTSPFRRGTSGIGSVGAWVSSMARRRSDGALCV
jgi:hypothetical protein